ncbi:alpha-L-fucosidase [Siphonobacter sp. SORGH_AS_1065]|uniref:alpha-L-fucosidase n=1 Tax=Siphonobacter sp. SORGH_AS_1065 TaxID=3041795 RepID=UPI00278774E9|nr:alpha-L-fucosidase [Siphonobacter sp. SORGH_AS_1065]MDQ1085545.1 alpha-L-fucosidase [Siphonobacter sp. SORGH_AS_1065]
MNRRTALKSTLGLLPALSLSNIALGSIADQITRKGPFLPTWKSLEQFQTPNWFKDAKFGMWAHWGPQCQPEAGDWYARGMYQEGSHQYNYHLKKYGHPSKFGFKDVIHEWKAENWDPEELVALYKQAGAQYFMAMANHHDNLDLYNSKHQPWNSTKVGPKKDIIGGWEKASRRQGLPFGVSVHAAHAWSWMETAQRSDKQGPYKGVPYDGNVTKADGKGKWWQGMDPQELYAQNHPLSKNSWDDGMIHSQWNWGNGVAKPTKAYCDKFLKRTIDLIDQYNPQFVYFDDTALPLWPIDDAGLKIAAHLYNKNIDKDGNQQAIVFGKVLDEQQRKCMVWDIERGQSNAIEPLPWQTDTCIGDWHYNRAVYDRKGYKSAKMVIQTLVDVVSKNGNLMLNIPVRGDGSIDEQERAVVVEIGNWMKVNSEAIYGTRPWKVFGEGPAQEGAAPLSAQGFNEGKGKAFTSQDIRFTAKGEALYATLMGWPDDKKVVVTSLASGKGLHTSPIRRVSLLGGNDSLSFEQTNQGLVVQLPENKPALSYANVLKIV